MLARIVTLVILQTTLLCANEPFRDSKLVGLWNISFLSSVSRVDFRADHTCTIWEKSAGRSISENGTWKLQGDHLSIQYKQRHFEVLVQDVGANYIEVTIPEDTWAVWTRAK
jgi:hypothetical protein